MLKKNLSEKIMDFVPQEFDLGTPNQALDYLRIKKEGSDFRMNDVIRVQTGVEKIEKISEEEKIEVRALEKLKEIQEIAYKEAYQLGLDEGRKTAFNEHAARIEDHLEQFGNLLLTIEKMKTQMLTFNETHLIKLMYQMASRLAQKHLDNNNPAIVDIIRNSVSLAQDEEEIVVRVSLQQFEFLEELKKENNRDYDFLKKFKLEPGKDVASGGCVIETNYGEVDARLEQRVNQLWEGISDALPTVKTKLDGNE